MDLEVVLVKCLLLEIDAWRNICVKSDIIKTLHFRWDPQCDSLKEKKVRDFFAQLLQQNSTIENIKMDFFHGELKQIKDKELKNNLYEEIQHFGDYITKCMRKKGLQSLSVNLQIIEPQEELKEKFSECVVDKIVHAFKEASSDISLVELKLDMDLCTDQMEKLINALVRVKTLKKLSLFNISSEIGGFRSLANLLVQGNILDLEISLNMTKNWKSALVGAMGAPDMFGTQITEYGERVFEGTIQSSNREGSKSRDDTDKIQLILTHLGSLLRSDDGSPELRRSQFYHIKSSQTVLPLPVCNGHQGMESGFHYVFEALKNPGCRLQSFHLNQCLFSRQAEYLNCLSEMITMNNTLEKLKIDNMMPEVEDENIQFTAPLFMSLCKNNSITTLDLSCLENITVNDTAFKVISTCLSQNKTLQSLNITGWKFNLSLSSENADCMRMLLENTNISELILADTEFHLSDDSGAASPLGLELVKLSFELRQFRMNNSSIERLNIDSVLVSINDHSIRTCEIISMFKLTALKELDISDKPKIMDPGEDGFIGDDSVREFFKNVSENFSSLEVLKMVNWKLKFSDARRTVSDLKQYFKSLTKLETISLNNIDFVTCKLDPHFKDPLFLKCLIKHLPRLKVLSILKANVDADQVPALVKALKYKVRRGSITLHTKHVNPDGHDELIDKLNKTSALTFKYDSLKGVIDINPPPSEPLIQKIKSVFHVK